MPSKTFQHSLEAKDTAGLAQGLCSALKALPSGTLPLEAGCQQGGMIDDRDIETTILCMEQAADQISARIGVFFTEIVGGCNCNDDPLETNAYCVLEVVIDRTTGKASISPAPG